MNNIPYNQQRHVKLLKREKFFLSQGKSFWQEDQEECLVLTNYNAAVDRPILWEERFKVASMMQAFMNKEVNGLEYRESVLGFLNIHIAKCHKFLSDIALEKEELKNFFPNKKADKLRGFLAFLRNLCEGFEMKWDEEKFYNTVQTGFLRFQEIINDS